MPRAILVVQTRPSDPSREDEFNEWYDTKHVPELCDIPGIVLARRFKISPFQTSGAGPDPAHREYLAIYEIESDDLEAVVAQIPERARSGRLTPSDAMQRDPGGVSVCYQLIEE